MARRRSRKGKKKGGRRFPGRRRGGGRRGRRGGRRVKARMGLIGKAGIIIAGGVPVAWGGINALAPWVDSAWAIHPIQTKLRGSLALFTNSLTAGYGLGATFDVGSVFPAGGTVAGTAETNQLAGAAPAGAWFKTLAAGTTLIVVDALTGVIVRFGAGRRAVSKFMGKQLISG